MFRYTWIWKKENGTGFANAHHQPLRMFEDICVFSKSYAITSAKKKMNYNPQGIISYNKMARRGGAGTNYNPKTLKKENYQEYTNYPRNILEYKRDKDKLHPTQKPVPLLEYLIKTYTQEDDTVLDNCMGSGSTGVASLNTKRRFIGIELDPTYFDVAKQRIQNAGKRKEET